jgi:hypothetical protein
MSGSHVDVWHPVPPGSPDSRPDAWIRHAYRVQAVAQKVRQAR